MNPTGPVGPMGPQAPTSIVMKGVAFVIVTIGVVALAGPFPTLVNGILILVLSGMILTHAGAFNSLTTWITNTLQGQSQTVIAG